MAFEREIREQHRPGREDDEKNEQQHGDQGPARLGRGNGVLDGGDAAQRLGDAELGCLTAKVDVALGFEVSWSSDELASVRYGETSFLLQAFKVPGAIARVQPHLLVEGLGDWLAADPG